MSRIVDGIRAFGVDCGDAERGSAGLIGVVLCGGQSQRMGRDKGLIEQEGSCWALRMGRKLAQVGLPVLYSIRAEQEDAYAGVLGEVMRVTDVVEAGGPVNGLLSVHAICPDSDLLVLACDMQDMDEETILRLLDEYRKGGAEFYVYYDGEFAEPFCAVYTAAGLEKVKAKIGEERSMRAVIGMGTVRRMEITRREAFGNYNS